MSVNPVFETERRDGALRLSRTVPSDRFRDEYAYSYEHTEPAYVLDSAADLDELLYRGVLTVFPEQYAGSPMVSRD